MARRSDQRERVEPSFDSERGDSDFRIDAADRVAGGGSVKQPARTSEATIARQKPGRARKRRDRKRRGILGGFLYWLTVLGIWSGIAAASVVLFYGARLPSANTWAIPARPPNVRITAYDGSIVANRGLTGGEALTLDEMSPYIPEAVIAVEDRRFYSHPGFDPFGLARALLANAINGRTAQGGSTLTQQLAKNLFLSPDRTMERKVQEVLLSFWLEHKFTKDQILEMYLNRMYFGSNAYGVEAASRRYFNKSARDVNLGEAAVLAGLLKAPSRLSPARDPDAANERAQLVLRAMNDAGFIDQSEIKTAMSQQPTRAKSYWSGAGQYAADMVMDDIKTLIGDFKEDLIVDTTLDPDLEKKAETALSALLSAEGAKLDVSQAALVSIDDSGAIRALVGGGDYATSQFNRAVKAKRQPGSAFKPFVYAAALEAGATPQSMRNDAPIRIGKWTPENYEQKYSGPVTIGAAFAQSLNTVAAQLVMEAGPANVIKLAHRLGIESELQANASIALGTSEVSLLELTSAYAPFMNGGFKATPHIVTRIRTAAGKLLYEGNFDNPPRVLHPTVVASMNDMLVRVISEGTGRNARIDGWQVAGKTGTTQSFRDALFVGYAANLVTGVWFGNDDGHSMRKVTGGGLPAKAWQSFMTAALKGEVPKPLPGGDRTPLPESPAVATAPPAGTGDDPLFSLIGRILNGTPSNPAKPREDAKIAPSPSPSPPPAPVGLAVPAQPPAPVGRATARPAPMPPAPMPVAVQGGSSVPRDLRPPLDVGRQSAQPAGSGRATLLDVILGQ